MVGSENIVGLSVRVSLNQSKKPLLALVKDKIHMRIVTDTEDGKESSVVTGYMVELLDGSTVSVPYFSIREILDSEFFEKGKNK